jgi:hypothetical protein
MTTVKPTKEQMTREDHVDQPIKILPQSAYSANKHYRWRRIQLGLLASDVEDERFRQCLFSDYLSLKEGILASNKDTDTDRCTQPASEGRK